jgi:hypothetical protein
MCSALVVIFLMATQKIAEMAFAENDHMVKAFTSDRTDEPLCISILPRHSGRDPPVPNAHRPDTLNEAGAINAVPIADHIVRPSSPKRFGQLLCDPFGSRVGRRS